MTKTRIRFLREQIGKTQGELADLINVKRYTVSDWENERTEPDIESINNLCKIFNVSSDYLLGLSNIPNPNEDNDIQLDDFQFALYGEVKDLTEEQKQTLLNMAKFLKDSNNGK